MTTIPTPVRSYVDGPLAPVATEQTVTDLAVTGARVERDVVVPMDDRVMVHAP